MPYESIPNSPGPSLPGPEEPASPAAGVQQELEDATTVGIQVDVPTSMESDAADQVYAKDLSMSNSAAVAASVLGNLEMDKSAVMFADVTGDAAIKESGVRALVTDGPVDLQGGMAGLVFAPEFTVRDGGSVLIQPREAAVVGAAFAGVLLLGMLLLRVLFPGRR